MCSKIQRCAYRFQQCAHSNALIKLCMALAKFNNAVAKFSNTFQKFSNALTDFSNASTIFSNEVIRFLDVLKDEIENFKKRSGGSLKLYMESGLIREPFFNVTLKQGFESGYRIGKRSGPELNCSPMLYKM